MTARVVRDLRRNPRHPTRGTPMSTTAAHAADDDSPLRRIDPPPRLLVPLSTPAAAETPDHLPPGTQVTEGQRLSEYVADAGAAALAATSGRVLGTTTVVLTNGQIVPALEIEVDFQDRAELEEHDSAT